MKEYSLPYGSGEQKVMLPEEHILYDIHGNKAAVAGDIKLPAILKQRHWKHCATRLKARR